MTKKLIVLIHILTMLALFSNPKLWRPNPSQKVKLHFKEKAKFSAIKAQAQISNKPKPQPSAAKQKTSPAPKTQPTSQPKKPKVANQKQAPKAEKPTQTTKDKTKSPSQEFLQKETIAKITEKIDKLEQITKGETKHKIEPLTSSNDHEENEVFSAHDVALYLFEMLELPGPGKVSVELVLDEFGKIENVLILDSENTANSDYLMQSLKDLRLPFEKKSHIPSNLRICFSNLKV